MSTRGGGLGSHTGFAISSATVINLRLLFPIEDSILAQSVATTCTSNGAGSSASTTIIGGSVHNVGPGQALAVSPAPNTTIPVLPGLTLTLNEQIKSDSAGHTQITVNGVHLHSVIGGGDVIFAQSRCLADGPDVLVASAARAPAVAVAPPAKPAAAAVTFTG
ncbi:MAG: hypothetical protein M3022_08090 [Actinomycetota bacterium]|nr:hypothetical protein [Actinomycetota bacterium]